MVGVLGCDSAPEGRWISDLRIDPAVISVYEGESARISFMVRDRQGASVGFARRLGPRITAVEAEIWDGADYRSFRWRYPRPGYKVAVWDGTFTGKRSEPPRSGRYLVSVLVTDESGRTERAQGHVWVSNFRRRVVLPRTQSGLRLESLHFDGSQVVLTDEAGNSIRVRAVSGLMSHNPFNLTGEDYTSPRFQWTQGRGPIPEGEYFIRRNDVQHPELVDGFLLFPSGATTERWGPMRAFLEPRQVGNRSEFSLHLDPHWDGSEGCIGIHPDDEGGFNQIMSLISWMPNETLRVVVRYPTEDDAGRRATP